MDAGDHPPITPMMAVRRNDLKSALEWQLYEVQPLLSLCLLTLCAQMVVLHFVASLSGPLQYIERTTEFIIGGEVRGWCLTRPELAVQALRSTHHKITARGWSELQPWRMLQLDLATDECLEV